MTGEETLDPYNLETLQPQMERLGYHFQYTPQTPTTMRLAEEHAKIGGSLPAVFLTDHQTQGIGREGRVWLDKPGASILVSQVGMIKSGISPVYVDLVALFASEVIKTQIKYPNDFVVDNEKVGGILVININHDGHYLATNTGIGINVHYTKNELADYPTDYGVTALDLHTPAANRREGLVLALMEGLKFVPIDAEVFIRNNQARQDWNNAWRAHSAVLQRMVRISSGDEILVEGRVVDTQISRGVLVESPRERNWFNAFDTKMKVRVN